MFSDRNYVKETKTYKMITYFQEKEALHTQNFMGRLTYKLNSPSSPRRQMRGREYRNRILRGKKITVPFTWNKTSIFFITVYFFPLS